MLNFLVCCTNQKGLIDMRRSINGKELGKGISQRKAQIWHSNIKIKKVKGAKP